MTFWPVAVKGITFEQRALKDSGYLRTSSDVCSQAKWVPCEGLSLVAVGQDRLGWLLGEIWQ